MQIVGPQSFGVGASTSVVDPAADGGNPSVAVQIQNSSGYQLLVAAAGGVLSIQSFTAQTIQITGAPITIQPLQGTGTGPCLMTLAFLLGKAPNTGMQLADGTWVESPPMTDGPLTAAAIANGLAGIGLAGVNGMQTTSVNLLTTATGFINMDLLAPNGYQLWNLGFGPATSWPTVGGVKAIILVAVPAYAFDTWGWQSGSSNRLAGLRVSPGNPVHPSSISFTNYTDVTLTCFADYVAL